MCLKLRQELSAASFRYSHQIAVAHAAISIEVRGRLQIERHAGFQHVMGKRMDARNAIWIGSREADAVPGRMLKCLTQTVFAFITSRTARSTSHPATPGRIALRPAACVPA